MHHVCKYNQMYQTEGILDITHHSIWESKHANILDYLTSMTLGISDLLLLHFKNIFAGS